MIQNLSIVIPAYNEEAAILAGKLVTVSTWLATQPYGTELIVVDDGSQDATAKLAQTFADQVIRIPHAGKASAIMAGIQAACQDVILITDMDQATPITEAPKLLNIVNSADVVVGSRGLVRQGAPLSRYVLSWGQVALRSLLLGLRMTDTQCGFKAVLRTAALDIIDHLLIYHPDLTSPIQAPSVTSGFDVEFLFVAQHLGYRIQEVPVIWNYQDTRRVSLAKDAWRGLVDLLRIATVALRGKYPKVGTPRRNRHPHVQRKQRSQEH